MVEHPSKRPTLARRPFRVARSGMNVGAIGTCGDWCMHMRVVIGSVPCPLAAAKREPLSVRAWA
eukprot:1296776-Prorocentrum_lima.AAC.1